MKIQAHNARAYVRHCDALEALATPAALARHGSGAAIYAKLRRIEARATRDAENVCNVPNAPTAEATTPAIAAAVARVLGKLPTGFDVRAVPYAGTNLTIPTAAAPEGLANHGGETFLAPKF